MVVLGASFSGASLTERLADGLVRESGIYGGEFTIFRRFDDGGEEERSSMEPMLDIAGGGGARRSIMGDSRSTRLRGILDLDLEL